MKEFIRASLSKYLYKSARSRAWFTMFGVFIKEIRVSFVQFFSFKNPFTIVHVIGVICTSCLRILLGKSVKYSFSHTGEDRIIESIYKPLIGYNGFYVDVGSNHPIYISNTYGLYRKGWRGICIDANRRLINKYKFFRPRDRAICALVSNEEIVRNYHLVQNDGLSTTSSEFVDDYKNQGFTVKTLKMKSKTLTSILDENKAPKTIDILSIDVEEHDYEVLISLNMDKYKPRLIIIEDETFDPLSPGANKIANYLFDNHYKLVGFILKNIYFQLEKNPDDTSLA